MKLKYYLLLAVVVVVSILLYLSYLYMTMGSGGWERMFVHSGVYAVERPSGYDAVCFLDADSKEGGLSCLPCSAVNDCKKN